MSRRIKDRGLKPVLPLQPVDKGRCFRRQRLEAHPSGRQQDRLQLRAAQEGGLATGGDEPIPDEHHHHGDQTDANGAEQRASEPIRETDACAHELAERRPRQHAEDHAGHQKETEEQKRVAHPGGRGGVRSVGQSRGYESGRGRSDRGGRNVAHDGGGAAQEARVEAGESRQERDDIHGCIEQIHCGHNRRLHMTFLLDRDDFSSSRHPGLACWRSMIFPKTGSHFSGSCSRALKLLKD